MTGNQKLPPFSVIGVATELLIWQELAVYNTRPISGLSGSRVQGGSAPNLSWPHSGTVQTEFGYPADTLVTAITWKVITTLEESSPF
jgi:hypothetical protein